MNSFKMTHLPLFMASVVIIIFFFFAALICYVRFLALLFGSNFSNGNHIGCIDPSCDITKVVEDAYSNARFLCDRYYLTCPELRLVQHDGEHLKKKKKKIVKKSKKIYIYIYITKKNIKIKYN